VRYTSETNGLTIERRIRINQPVSENEGADGSDRQKRLKDSSRRTQRFAISSDKAGILYQPQRRDCSNVGGRRRIAGLLLWETTMRWQIMLRCETDDGQVITAKVGEMCRNPEPEF
jgi:hypothetical protein